MKRNRTTLKGYFIKGAIPTEANFADLIDSMLIQDDDNISKLPNDPLRITASGTEENLLNFYRKEGSDETLTWQIKQKPEGSGNSGLSIGDAAASRFYIESGTGNVGIGTTTPGARLAVHDPAAGAELRVSGEGGKIGLHLGSDRNHPWIGTYTNHDLRIITNSTVKVRVTAGGNVGIGTQEPRLGLDVRGWIGSGDSSHVTGGWRLGRWPGYRDANTWLYLSKGDSASDATNAYQDLAIGSLWAGGAVQFGSASDLAEMTPVNVDDGLEAGDVVVIDEPPDDRVLLAKSRKPYDAKVAGVVSDMKSAGLVIGGCHTEDIGRNDVMPIALAGRVLTKVTLENGSIEAGDFLTSSSTPGHAMKATRSGPGVGKALQSFDGGAEGATAGKIWILVNLSWFGEPTD